MQSNGLQVLAGALAKSRDRVSSEYHALLTKYWDRLGLGSDQPIFVPLCGKSLDMVWLANRGHLVIGVELSELAIDAFFAEQGLTPSVRMEGDFQVKSAGAYQLWCGDIFMLPSAAVAEVGGVYDRAALVALPVEQKQMYAAKLKSALPASAPILLMSLDYDQAKMSGPPFATSRRQIQGLFGDAYVCEELECREVIDTQPQFRQRGLASIEESAFLLRHR